jgi:hypothetical protein
VPLSWGAVFDAAVIDNGSSSCLFASADRGPLIEVVRPLSGCRASRSAGLTLSA